VSSAAIASSTCRRSGEAGTAPPVVAGPQLRGRDVGRAALPERLRWPVIVTIPDS